ncbi:39S ribosomal protein L32, mitochondrial isoform X2 [Anopheles nili]|uniref:39S ribosomal protein L32, mitochondrial isoform X2 n=1 Tax=Anopheles nili TaxID=185578 RepID=UPI00237AD6C9|nr:39S ribosomal protein L32, mitochondrial isoform X2 [Anopheles nili]
MYRFLNRLSNSIRSLESYIFGGNGFPPALAQVDCMPMHASSNPKKAFSLRDLIGDGLLWAVPKHRRTVEKRHKRKYGSPQYKLKIFLPKTHLRSCATCGSDHEVGVLCPVCYKKIRTETELMQENIQKELGLDPVDKEVVVLYDREKDEQPDEFWQGKRIVEMEKRRPMWFSKNMLQKSTQSQSEPDELKPGHEKLG